MDSLILTKTLPCLADPGKIIVIGKPSRSLEDVIPYLATLPGVMAYNPETATLTFRRAAGFLTLYPEMIYITQVQDTSEGLDLLNALRDAINATWEHRRELVAVSQAKRAPRPLDIWTLLPQTNCKQCGEATCMAFAVGLIQQTHVLEDCKPIQQDEAYQERKATLSALIC
ncbi:MAG: (Fe-S)-binding protein [Anaerolineales bacterium]